MNNLNQKMSHYRWTICGLLFFATTVNYLDRQVLSLLQTDLAQLYNWTNSDYAMITVVFQFGYAISMLFAGRFIDWAGTKNGYAWALALWSVGAIIHAVAEPMGAAINPMMTALGFGVGASVLGFMISRLVLAIGEAGNFPAAIKTTAEWFPKKERSFATGIFNSGSNVGAILAPLTVPAIAKFWGWEMAFILVGGVGFLWLAFWFYFYESPKTMLKKGRISQAEYDLITQDKEEAPAAPITDQKESISWFKLLTYRQTWSFVFGKFMTDGVWWFFLFWLPAYLKAEFGLENTAIALPLAVLYSMTMVGSIGGGWFPAYFINKGMEPYKARVTAMFTISLIPLIVLILPIMQLFEIKLSFWIPVVLIGIGASAHQAFSANIFTTVSDMFPKKAVASVTGIGGMAGGMGGALVSFIAGILFDHYQALGNVAIGYAMVFAYCAVAYIIAVTVMKILVPRFKPITDL